MKHHIHSRIQTGHIIPAENQTRDGVFKLIWADEILPALSTNCF